MYESLTGVGWWLKYWETFIWWVILISSMYLNPTHAVAKSLFGSVLCKLKTSLLLIAECPKFSHQLYPADKDVHFTDPCTCILDTNINVVSLYNVCAFKQFLIKMTLFSSWIINYVKIWITKHTRYMIINIIINFIYFFIVWNYQYLFIKMLFYVVPSCNRCMYLLCFFPLLNYTFYDAFTADSCLYYMNVIFYFHIDVFMHRG